MHTTGYFIVDRILKLTRFYISVDVTTVTHFSRISRWKGRINDIFDTVYSDWISATVASPEPA